MTHFMRNAFNFKDLTTSVLSWMFEGESGDAYTNALEGLRDVYKTIVLPLEEQYRFHEFHSPAMEGPDFSDKPMILLVGQYSTGKTTFLRYLLGKDFPGMRIGPEPTTDCFMAVMHGETDTVIPGNALVVDDKRQFRSLSKFGTAFLNRFQCSTTRSHVLRRLTIIDTPGILSGEKQRVDRGYDFEGVIKWFAERVDRIVLLFDCHKLDISDEFRRTIEVFKECNDKICIVLNKADMMDQQHLMQVYGALMFSLGKVLKAPEVPRLFIGSFWDQPLQCDVNRRLFEAEKQALFADLQSLPRNIVLRKLNDFVKRVRLAKAHAYIISELKEEMPYMFGIEAKKRELISNLSKIYQKIHREHQISLGDFPDVTHMQEQLQQYDFRKFNAFNPKLLKSVDKMLAEDISKLMAMIPEQTTLDKYNRNVRGGAFDNVTIERDNINSGDEIRLDADARCNEDERILAEDRNIFDKVFASLNPINGKVSGSTAKQVMLKSNLPETVLDKVWKLADHDKDGMLDSDEFALVMYLINIKLDDSDLADYLSHINEDCNDHSV